MLNFLRWSITISSATLISSLSFFSAAGVAQNRPVCFMRTSSGRVVDLDNLCRKGQQTLQKAGVYQGPFDRDGFPLIFSKEVDQLKAAITKARQRNVEPQDDAGIQQAVKLLVNKMPFGAKYRELRQVVKSLSTNSQSVVNPNITEQQKIESLTSELLDDQSFTQFRKALENNGLHNIPF